MNRNVAYRLLQGELDAYRKLPHQEFAFLAGDSTTVVRQGDDATEFSIDVSVSWRSDPGGDLVVSASIGAAEWGSPLDRLDESIVVSALQESNPRK